MLAISLTLASRSCRDPSPVGQKEEVTTVGTRVAPTLPEASRSKRATSSKLGKEASLQEMGSAYSCHQGFLDLQCSAYHNGEESFILSSVPS